MADRSASVCLRLRSPTTADDTIQGIIQEHMRAKIRYCDDSASKRGPLKSLISLIIYTSEIIFNPTNHSSIQLSTTINHDLPPVALVADLVEDGPCLGTLHHPDRERKHGSSKRGEGVPLRCVLSPKTNGS